MDINQHKLANHSWDAEVAVEDQIFHNPDAFNSSLFPSYSFPLQTNQILPSSSSSHIPLSTTLLFADQTGNSNSMEENEEPEEQLGAMKEMMYRIAAMQPVDIDPTTIRKPNRRNIRISDDPQSVAARHRRERISEKIRILQRLVPGGTKMDTASMLDEAIRYVKFLKKQIRLLQTNQCTGDHWQLTPNNNNKKKLPFGTASSTASLDAVTGLTFNGNSNNNNNNNRNNSICFNHHEVD